MTEYTITLSVTMPTNDMVGAMIQGADLLVQAAKGQVVAGLKVEEIVKGGE